MYLQNKITSSLTAITSSTSLYIARAYNGRQARIEVCRPREKDAAAVFYYNSDAAAAAEMDGITEALRNRERVYTLIHNVPDRMRMVFDSLKGAEPDGRTKENIIDV